MRVLWFASGPTSEISDHLFNKKINPVSWIEALYPKLASNPGLEMGFVFRSNTSKLIKVELNKTKYYAVPINESFSGKLFDMVFCKVDSRKRVKHYVDIINEFNPDVIHIFGTETDFGLIQEFTDCPIVIQMQGIINNYVNYYFHAVPFSTVFFNTKLYKLLIGSTSSFYHNYLRFKKQALREKRILKPATHIIGFTEFDRRAALIMGNNVKYYYIPWMLRADFYKSVWRYPKRNIFRVISTINPQIYKGLETVYRTSYLLNKGYPGEFEFIIVGIASESVINTLIKKTLSVELIKNTSLCFKGNLKASNLVEELLESHILMHPSLCDTSPNSICEAMILGMPVVSTNVGGIPSIIEDGVTGYLIQSMDHLSFAQVIYMLKSNPLKAEAIGLKAREVALARHNETVIIEQTIGVYKELSKK